jgi:hypothetical protein
MGSHPASGGYKKFSRILRRRPRPTLGCGVKERRRRRRRRIGPVKI